MSDLFDDVRIGSLIIPNRLVRSATWEGMCEKDGTPTTKLEKYYETLARGGIGLLISGYAFVRADGKQLPGKMGIDSDDKIPALRTLTSAARNNGSRIFCQLVHAGGQANAKETGSTPMAPSAIESSLYPVTPKEMSAQDIAEIIHAFGEGARRAKEAGFDGVQLHGAHGYLINQFLSPLTNKRTDRYGGSLEGRAQFLKEAFEAVREKVGLDYPVAIKLTASDNLEGGFSLEDAVEISRMLQNLGIDAIEVSSGTAASGDQTPVRQGIDTEEKEAYNATYAAAIKKSVNLPVMVVGGIRSGTVAKRILSAGQADFIALSRPLIREPDLPRLWQNDPHHRARCISCNGCFKPGLKEGGIYCVIDKIEQQDPNPAI
ncbi:NADH:flavin oxidoreductase [Geoalkalibacter subterraneus]|uniref:NADH-dependent flavin oxidoreductase n=1 Tax=Geoalkalibacter subterraneus TaxID=483547 RepID=A0A0B5FS02_9BACT|nr:NADH:flavin oxidoreductase [Geoalkalibacter subterraneus]AJF06925.1 NADH-dependent flavin oxidoreductase [Geoalkalibacter subterraneus]